MGAVDVAILDPHGNKDTARPTITQKADGVWVVEYSATAPGLHSVNVFFAGKSIPNSPFGVLVSPGLLFVELSTPAFASLSLASVSNSNSNNITISHCAAQYSYGLQKYVLGRCFATAPRGVDLSQS